MSSDAPIIHIHADESCLGNQNVDRERPGGAAGLIEHWAGGRWERRDYWICEPDTTNNRMALCSALEGLRHLKRRCRVLFVSDSQYLVKGMAEWVPAWKRRGWKRKGGGIENLALWKALDLAAAAHEIEWRWVRGHHGHAKNEYANHLAIGASRRQDDSAGLAASRFDAWLAAERERGRYIDYYEFLPPGEG